MDVDLVLSRSLYLRLMRPADAESAVQAARFNRTVFIVPAFDVDRRVDRSAWADALVSAKKDMVVIGLIKGLVHQFDVRGFPQVGMRHLPEQCYSSYRDPLGGCRRMVGIRYQRYGNMLLQGISHDNVLPNMLSHHLEHL
jgi:hypothetical protein